jgi:hypothetical protein
MLLDLQATTAAWFNFSYNNKRAERHFQLQLLYHYVYGTENAA